MRPFVVRPLSRLKGEISLPGDKSIAHRSIIISALASGRTEIKNFPSNKDCLSTIKAFRKLGIRIRQVSPAPLEKGYLNKENSLTGSVVNVFGKGLQGLHKSVGPIFTGDSGTTLRLLLGVLAGQHFKTKLAAGKSLSHRPMLRVTSPLRMMGAKINAKRKTQNAKIEEYSPITIIGGNLRSITYTMPVASAQVKSAIILAALYTNGKTRIIERIPTRDHTERLLRLFRAKLKVNPSLTTRGKEIVIEGSRELLSPGNIYIPADISSAAFFLVAAAIIPNSQMLIRDVSLNPTRTGIIKVLKRMGADIKIKKSKIKNTEPAGDILIKSGKLRGTIVKRDEIPSLIDELPILMVAASLSEGKTVFEGVAELRVKETDRIKSMTCNLKQMGANIAVFKGAGSEKIIIEGVKQFKAARVRSFGDHRTAMSMVVAGLAASGPTLIDDISCIDKSFPEFISLLDSLKRLRKI